MVKLLYVRKIYQMLASYSNDYILAIPSNNIFRPSLDLKIEGVLSLYINTFATFYSIKGKDCKLLFPHLPFNNISPTIQGLTYNPVSNPNIQPLPPVYNEEYGYIYEKNIRNKLQLEGFYTVLSLWLKQFSDYQLDTTISPLHAAGVIGYTTYYKESAWLISATGEGWHPKGNPERLDDGTWLFKKCSVASSVTRQLLLELRKLNQFHSLYPDFIELRSRKHPTTICDSFDDFIKDERYNTALFKYVFFKDIPLIKSGKVEYIRDEIGGSHAMFCYKDENGNIELYDTTGHDLENTIVKDCKEYPLKFVKRKRDQAIGEGSCVLIAVARALMVATYGKDGATKTMLPSYPILLSRLVTILRRI